MKNILRIFLEWPENGQPCGDFWQSGGADERNWF
jgi:hypothetical protein